MSLPDKFFKEIMTQYINDTFDKCNFIMQCGLKLQLNSRNFILALKDSIKHLAFLKALSANEIKLMK